MQINAKQTSKMKFLRSPEVIFGLIALFLLVTTSATNEAFAQQVPDMEFQYNVKIPAYKKGTGPILLIDKAHSPYLQRGSYDPFAKLVRDDGFQTNYLETKITENTLARTQILIVVNSYQKSFAEFPLLQPPSAYESSEIAAIKNWVTKGGRLLIIADHAPFAGGTSALAEAFGFIYFNGYVFKKSSLPFRHGNINYQLKGGLNQEHPIVSGEYVSEKIEQFFTFTGSAFIPPAEAMKLLTVPEGYVAIMTQSLRREAETAPKINVSGLSAGSTMKFGDGRLAIFAEAAAFSAQTVNKIKTIGMNNPKGAKNPLFVLATMRWLADGL